MHSSHPPGFGGPCARRVLSRVLAVAPLLGLLAIAPPAVAGTTLAHIKEARALKIGYVADRAFVSKDGSGNPAGYTISLCKSIADAVKAEIGLPDLAVDFVAVPAADEFKLVEQGKIDLLCDATTPTLALRKTVSFSIPIFISGTAALVRKDASERLRAVLAGRSPAAAASWRANADQLIRQSTVSVVSGSPAERTLAGRLGEMQLIPTIVPVPDYATGVARVIDGRSNVLFGDRIAMLEAVRTSSAPGDLTLLDRSFAREEIAFALPRDDEDFRLLVDSALSRQFRSSQFHELYAKSFGQADEREMGYLLLNALPE